MTLTFSRRLVLSSLLAAGLAGPGLAADDKIQLRLSTPGTETDQRSVAMAEVFGPAVSEFASYEPSYNATLFAQGTELEAMSRGNLEMGIVSAQDLAQFFPEFSIFTAGYVHQDAAHQVAVFNDPLMDTFKQKVEEELGVKLLSVMYLGRRQVNLRQTKDELTVTTPRRSGRCEPADARHRRLAISRQGIWAPAPRRCPSRRFTQHSPPGPWTGRTTRCRPSSIPSSTR